MFEIIPNTSQDVIVIITTIFFIIGTATAFLFLYTLDRIKPSLQFQLWAFSFAMLITGVIIIVSDTSYDDWLSKVTDQIQSLECSDLEKAYEVYGLDLIKSEYLERCTDEVREWWK